MKPTADQISFFNPHIEPSNCYKQDIAFPKVR